MLLRPLFAAVLLVGAISLSSATAPAIVEADDQGQDQTTTLTDQSEVSLTVYNSDLALVRDVRRVRLASGVGDLHFMDIAATVNPASVHFRSLTDAPGVNVLEQNYEYDLLEPDKLLRKYVGRDVTLVRMRSEGGTTRVDVLATRASADAA